MSNSEHKPWVLSLPKLWLRKPRIGLKDPNVIAQIVGLAQKYNVTKKQVAESLLGIGILVSENTLVLCDQMGFEKPVNLMDEDFAPEQGGKNSKIIVSLITPISKPNYLTEKANEYNVSPEEFLTRMCKLGIRIAQAKNNPDITYTLKMQGGRRIDLRNTKLF